MLNSWRVLNQTNAHIQSAPGLSPNSRKRMLNWKLDKGQPLLTNQLVSNWNRRSALSQPLWSVRTMCSHAVYVQNCWETLYWRLSCMLNLKVDKNQPLSNHRPCSMQQANAELAYQQSCDPESQLMELNASCLSEILAEVRWMLQLCNSLMLIFVLFSYTTCDPNWRRLHTT